MKIVLVGAREDGLAHTVLEHLEHHTPHEVVGFLDETPGYGGKIVFGRPVFGPPSEVGQALAAGAEGAMIAIGHGPARARIAPLLREAGLELITVVAPTAYVAPSAELGEGVLVGANATVGTGARVGDLSVLLAQSVVGHHAAVGEAATLSGASLLAGRVRVGARALIGLGAKVSADVSIGDDAIVGAGAVVLRDVADGATVAGVPARVLG